MTLMDRIWEVLGWVFVLNDQVFQLLTTQPGGLTLAIAVTLLAGLSQAIAQSIILFINRVVPIRFILSLFTNVIINLFDLIFLVASTWLFCQLFPSIQISFLTLLIILGISYAPLLFSFLGALPYLGVPLLRLLSIWHLLIMVVGLASVANVSVGSAFGYVAIGWFGRELSERTIGQPIAKLGKAIANRAAGVELVEEQQALTERMRSNFGLEFPPLMRPAGTPMAEVQQLIQASDRAYPQTAQAISQMIIERPSEAAIATRQKRFPKSLKQFTYSARTLPEPVKLGLSLFVLVVLFIFIGILLRPIRNGVFGWYQTLPRFSRYLFDIGWIGIVALIFAGLLAPFETLGWWAGWFGESVDLNQTTPKAPENNSQKISRYVIYLDGVGQSGEEYTPDIEDFLSALEPVLPKNVKLVRGLMLYSVLNKPLIEDRPLAFLWRQADKMRWANPAALLGILVNVRNMLIVAVSADRRYGPLYNRGIAQVIYNGLLEQGYQPGSGIPITLIGYSGGGQMAVASAPYLKEALDTTIDTISLGGVMSANNNFLKLEHLYHVVGEKDFVEKAGPVMFPGRWKLFPLSYWNRADRKGKISILSAGAVGHQVPGGYMDPNAVLPDGRTHLQQTLEIILQILSGKVLEAEPPAPIQPSNYGRYKEAPFNNPDYYPIHQSIDLNYYRAIAPWMGRLILPRKSDRSKIRGVLFEVHHAPQNYKNLVGQTMILRWSKEPFVQRLVRAAKRDVHFSADAEYTSKYGGLIHPNRINHWQQVDPLESLAGSHPEDDLIVMLNEPVEVENDVLRIQSQPVQITGRYYALVKFVQALQGTDQFEIVHFNPKTRQFDSAKELVRLPEVIADVNGIFPSSSRNLEQSPFNETGWYIYGAKNHQGLFVVQSLVPRKLFRLQPDQVVFGQKASYNYVRKQAWANIKDQKGKISSVLCVPQQDDSSDAIAHAIQQWQEGDRALLVHVYGGIGGEKAEPAAKTPIFFGHFAFGFAKVIRDPFTDELRFDWNYHQVYTHNTDGIIAGVLHSSRYLSDRQFGWIGTRPICDILIKHPAFTENYDFGVETKASPLKFMMAQLEVMTARYRIGDGTGGTYVAAANNCAQDSNQALFASLGQMERAFSNNRNSLQPWRQSNFQESERLQDLLVLGRKLQRSLQPLGGSKSAWERNEYNLGSTLEDEPLRNLITGLGSWRTLLPRYASDTVVKIFLEQGATLWVLRTNQIGGYAPEIAPIAPMTL